MSLKKQIILWSIFICSAILLISNLLNYRQSTEIMQSQLEEKTLQSMKQAEYNIVTLSNEVDKLSKMIGASSELAGLFEAPQKGGAGYLNQVNSLFKYLEGYLINYDYLDSIFVMNDKKECIGIDRNRTKMADNSLYSFRLMDEVMERRIREHYPDMVWLGVYKPGDFIEQDSDFSVLSSARIITSYLDGKEYVLYMNIAEDKLRAAYASGTRDTTEKMYLVDEQGIVLSGTQGSVLGEKSLTAEKVPPEEVYGNFQQETKGDKKEIIYYRIDKPDWLIMKEVPLTYLSESISVLKRNLIVMLAVSIGVIIVLYSYLIGKITGPLYKLLIAMQAAGEHPGQCKIENRTQNEIGRLIDQFNEMDDKIAGLIEEKAEDERRKTKMEIQLLQAQINPHFLYNTLNMIKWMAMMQRASNIVDSIVALSGILKPVFSSSKPMHTIGEEMEYLKNYLIIMNYRYSNNIDFRVDMEEGVEQYRMLRFSLQPLIENSFIHGFDQGCGNGVIELRIHKSGNDLEFCIKDSGKGIDEELLEKIRSALSQDCFREHVGLENINKRLKLNFGSAYGLEIDSDGKSYTLITMRTPQIQ